MINTQCDFKSFRIATTEVDLTRGYFFTKGIDAPTTFIYKSFSEPFSQSFGGQVQHGFPNVTMTWVNVSSKTVKLISEYVRVALATPSRQIFLTIPVNNGIYIARHWVDISGTPYPIDTTEGGVLSSFGMFFDNLTLFINNISIVNDPAVLT